MWFSKSIQLSGFMLLIVSSGLSQASKLSSKTIELNGDTLFNEYFNNSDQMAKKAVGDIVKYTGLPANFRIIERNVPTAIAYVKNKIRYIGYNPGFMAEINQSTLSNWPSISVLAHEIGHHLAGHTLDPKKSIPGDELEADIFSGFILGRMGATLEETKAAMMQFKSQNDSKTHPPKESRLTAIETGWNRSRNQNQTEYSPNVDSISESKIVYELVMKGDPNLYYIDDNNRVIWFDNYGFPIVIGKIESSSTDKYEWIYVYDEENYGIDKNGKIWMITNFDALMVCGQIYAVNE